MKNKLLFLISLVCVLFFVILFEMKLSSPKLQNVFFEFTKDELKAVTLKNENGEFRLTEKHTEWMLEGAHTIPANREAMMMIIASLQKLRYERRIENRNEKQLSDYGLTIPKNRVTVELKNGKAFSLVVGSVTQVGMHNYVMVDGSKAVYLIKNNQLPFLHFSYFDLRSLIMITTPLVDVLSIRYTDELRTISIHPDHALADGLLELFRNLEIEKVIEPSLAGITNYNLDYPDYEIVFEFAEENATSVTLKVSQFQNRYYAVLMDTPYEAIVRLNKESVENILTTIKLFSDTPIKT